MQTHGMHCLLRAHNGVSREGKGRAMRNLCSAVSDGYPRSRGFLGGAPGLFLTPQINQFEGVLAIACESLGNDCQEKRGVLTTGLDSSLIATIADRFTCGTGVGK
jgi:hypothetical protein